jgi:site-specific recombinase XerD
MITKGEVSARKGGHYPGEPLTEDDVRAMLAHCSRRAPTGIRNRALLTLMYRAGLRISEAIGYRPRPGEARRPIRALRPSDIDFKAGTLHVLDAKGSKDRIIGLNDGAMAVLGQWIDVRRSLGISRGPLFCTMDGKPMSDRYVRDMMKRLAGKAGIDKHVRPHGLRHGNASEMLAEGNSVGVISKHLGHSSIAVTSRYLDHIAPADVISAGRSREWADS